jgi:hypothetical protein
MSVLDLKEGTLDHNITQLFYNANQHPQWVAFVKSLDPNIIKVEDMKGFTRITFKSDEHKTWFILRWS